MQVLTDAQWAVLAPLIEEVRPRGKTHHHDLRRTIEAILWRHQNGAKWRSIPAELGPRWMAAQTFIRWAAQGIWETVFADLTRDRENAYLMIDRTIVRAHQQAATAKGRPKSRLWGVAEAD